MSLAAFLLVLATYSACWATLPSASVAAIDLAVEVFELLAGAFSTLTSSDPASIFKFFEALVEATSDSFSSSLFYSFSLAAYNSIETSAVLLPSVEASSASLIA
tara:strand:- start:356 stop:667 length:312 start_codon:yes stop_codon:yes gene_type:complete